MNCPNCKSEDVRIDSASADGKEIYIFCNSCRLYSTLYRKGEGYTNPNDISQGYISEEKEAWKDDPTYQNC